MIVLCTISVYYFYLLFATVIYYFSILYEVIVLKYGFIGVGNMCSAILDGIVKSGKPSATDIYLYDTDDTKCDRFIRNGMKACLSAASVARLCDVLFLCIKPQIMPKVLKELSDAVKDGAVVVSIAAGISAEKISSALKNTDKIIQVMPNTPLMLGEGAVALSATDSVSTEEFAKVYEIFSSCGVCRRIPLDKMNEIIAVNGSSPAFIYLMTKYVCDVAEENGIDREVAKALFCQSLIGSAKMMTDSGMEIDKLIEMVSSPGGTTIQGLNAMRENGAEKVVREAFDACTKRAYELGE